MEFAKLMNIYLNHSLAISFRRMVQAQKQESINSLLGHAKATNSLTYMLKIIKEAITNGKAIQIPKNYERRYNTLPCRA